MIATHTTGRVKKVPLSELEGRMKNFRSAMDAADQKWEIAALFGKINQYYFTGTMQDGVLLIPRDGEPAYWVRRSYERALDESAIPYILQMKSFRDITKTLASVPGTFYLETDFIPIAHFERFRKHIPFDNVKPVEEIVSHMQAKKSAYELSLMERAGAIHRHVLEDLVPGLLTEGIGEAEFRGRLLACMVREGHDGAVRFGRFGSEIMARQVGFGENPDYPTYMDGPGSARGTEPAVPPTTGEDRKLRKGELVYIDNVLGVDGYQTCKAVTYQYGGSLSKGGTAVHRESAGILRRASRLLKPGAIPSQIYDAVAADLRPDFVKDISGSDNRVGNFLGYGTGLFVGDPPLIARGFDEPLEEGMVIVIGSKVSVRGEGTVGTRETFVVTPDGGRPITGSNPGLILTD